MSSAVAGHAQVKLNGSYSSDDLPKYVVLEDSNFEPENLVRKDPYHDVLKALEEYLDADVKVRSRTALLNKMDGLGFEYVDSFIRGSSNLNNIRSVNNNSDFDNFLVFKRIE